MKSGTEQSENRAQSDNFDLVLYGIAGFVVSAILLVVIPPFDLALLIGLAVATFVQRSRHREQSQRLLAMLLFVVIATVGYALVQILSNH